MELFGEVMKVVGTVDYVCSFSGEDISSYGCLKIGGGEELETF